jgi:flavin-dependent dehydrogenase
MIEAEVAVVGGGPAGSLVAAGLALAGHDVVLLEASRSYRWRACGVFSSPATVAALRRAGVPDGLLAVAARPIPAMRVETPGGVAFRLAYGGPDAGPVGFDRSSLDPALLARAETAGARVCRGTRVEALAFGPRGVSLDVRHAGGGPERMTARLVIGADGGGSVVARAAGVARPARLGPRVGLTFHLPDRLGDPPADARMRVFDDGYVGIAPVPGGRVNVGIVLGRSWLAGLRRGGAAAVARQVLEAVPVLDGAAGSPADPAVWRGSVPLDAVAGASPLGHRVTRRAGDRWLLAGDAAGFLDPFTGEGLHRAVVSASLAVRAASRAVRADGGALAAYDRAMRRRFAAKDIVSWLVQAFLGRPELFEYAARRVEARPAVRETMGLVMGDLVPASRALDPRFLGALLRP